MYYHQLGTVIQTGEDSLVNKGNMRGSTCTTHPIQHSMSNKYYCNFELAKILMQRSTCTTQVQIDLEGYTYYHLVGTFSQKVEENLEM